MKFVKWLAKATSWLLAHTFEAMITGITTIAAFASLYLSETVTEKILYFVGFLMLGFVVSIGLARLRGEDKEYFFPSITYCLIQCFNLSSLNKQEE